jgi:beta-lactamase regulating signal transducer with metallopeptidase domain
MPEHIAPAVYYLGVHLLYASLVWLAAWVLTSIPRGSATTKYWIWVATSLNFMLPAGAVFDQLWASHLSWARPLSFIGDIGVGIARNTPALVTLCVAWLLGAILMAIRLCWRIRADQRHAHASSGQSAPDPRPRLVAQGVPVRFAESRQAPAVDGVLRPYISLPSGIDGLLSEHELDAVLIHELTHARRRDNLTRLIYEVSLCALWFHPLVWITGSRLSLYRELSCDEAVIQRAHGGHLVSALAKLANPEEELLLQATASSFLSRRLARLAAAHPRRTSRLANALLTVVFCAVLLAGVLETIGHTACCFAPPRDLASHSEGHHAP